MIVSVNGYVLNDPTNANSAYLDEPIDGLGLPPIRTSSGTYSGRDGGYVGSQFYGMRLITLTGRFFSTSPAVLESTRRAIAAALASPTVPLTITTNAGNNYLINCFADSLNMPINRSINSAPFKITLIAADPTIYDNSGGGLNTASLAKILGGGITWPISWNPVTWAAGSSPTTVSNTGNVNAYPLITLSDVMTNPTVTNTTTGQFFSLSGLTTVAGDKVVIDMANHTVLLNGGPIYTYATLTSTFWPLIPGSNTVSLKSSVSGDTVSGVMTWRSGYRGI